MEGATVTDHAVWWLWPNTCLLRYPGRGNFMVLQIFPDGPDRSIETWDFYLESTDLNSAEREAVKYIDEVLQVQDIAIVESVQRGMKTPAFDQGRIVYDASKPDGTPRKLLDVSKLTALGWAPKIALKDGIAGTYRWYQEHGAAARS